MAVFTLLHDVSKMFNVWLRYYSRWFESRDIYVLAHGIRGDVQRQVENGAQQGLFNLIPVHQEYSYCAVWLASTATMMQRLLLQSYRAVVFSAVDEIVVWTGEGGLRQYLANPPDMARCHGYEIVQRREQEPALVFEQPVLDQRRWWAASQRYSKPLIGTLPIYWRPGFSSAANLADGAGLVPNLYVLHLHKADFNFMVYRHRELAARRWHPPELRQSRYAHNRLEDPEQLAAWMLGAADDPKTTATLLEIPETVRVGTVV